MKKLFIILQSTFICLAMILVGFVFGNGATVNADSTESKVYANDFYTIAYENNEFKLLLNADLTVYKNLKAEDLTALKDNLASVIYAAILDDLDFTELAAATTATSSNPLFGDVDMSLIGSIIGGQLTDVDKVDEALSGNKYDVLIEYYVDRYVDAYVEANVGASVEDTLVEVQTQLTETIQKTVEEVYKDVDGEDLSEYAPLVDVASKVENIVTQVQENKQNDTQINVSLGDVKDIINIVNDKQVIVDVINEIQVKDEISDIIVNSTPEEAVDFITNVEMDTIIEVYKNVEISKEEVKDIITNVGTDNLIDIVDKVGIDSIKDLANAMDFTKEELKETITNSVADISVASIIKTIKFISVDGAKVYEEGQFVAAGLGTIVKKLPKLSEIATLSDDKMNWSWNIKASTILGDVEFKLTVGFKGNCSYIRKLAQELADVIDVKVENGVYFVEINSPEKLSNILLRLTNTGALSDDVKHALFANLFGTVDNLYQNITDKTLAEYIEVLKQVDYKVVVANLYNAEKLNSVFGTDKFTDEKLDAFVDEVCGLISKAAAYDYDDVKALVGKYVDISKLDDTAVETLVNKASTVLKEIDALSIDSALIREFIDPNSKYTNENVYDYLDKLENYEGYYNKALELVEKLYNKVPDRYKDNTVLDFYQGNGKFNYTGTVNLELEKVLTTINKNYGQKVYDALSILFDTLPEKLNVSITLNIKNVYSVTYHVGNEIIEGMLPAGADVAFFANRTEIDGNAITKWVDKDGTEYTTMPNYDVELYACAEYVASIESGVNKKYDGKPFTLKVNIEPAAPYTYQWYKNGVAVYGATKETLDVINVADSGTYYCVVTLGNTVYTTNSVEVVIERGFIDLRDAVWAYPHPFDYTGQQYEVKLVGTLANVTVSYIGNKATNAGKYIAQAVFTYDEANYVLSEKIVTLSWEIRKAKIYVEGLEWNYVNPFTYDEASHEVKLTNVPANLTVAYEGNVATNAGKYTAKAVVSCADANYELIGGTSELTWEIAKGKIDVSGLSWKYSKGFTYNGAEFGVELNGTVKGATPKYENNKATKAGKYVAKVTFEYDQANYELTGEVEDLTWEIRKAKIDVTKVEWNYSGAFTEDGTEKQVSLKADSIPAGVTVAYENNKATAAGKYVAVAKFALNDTDNYELVGTDAKLSWEIKAKTVDPEPHKHVFVDGVCECGEKDPNYVEPEVGKKEFEVKDENGKVVVTITSQDGVVAAEVSLKELNAKDYDLDLEALFGEDKVAKLLAVYDIEFLDENGKPLELTGEFTVKLLLSEEHKDLEGLTVVHIAEDGTTTEHTAKVEGEYITFSTTHFSVYSLVQVKDAPSNAWVIWLVIILLIAIVVPVVFIVIKKKNK